MTLWIYFGEWCVGFKNVNPMQMESSSNSVVQRANRRKKWSNVCVCVVYGGYACCMVCISRLNGKCYKIWWHVEQQLLLPGWYSMFNHHQSISNALMFGILVVSQWSGQTKRTDIVAKIEWNDRNQQLMTIHAGMKKFNQKLTVNKNKKTRENERERETRKTFAPKRY